MQEGHGSPGRLVGQADVADLAGLDLLGECFEGLLQGREVFVLVAIAQLAEVVGAAFGPVQLVDVDPVGLQALEAGVERSGDVVPVVLQVAVADVGDAVARPRDLACQDPVSPIRLAANQLPMMVSVAP